MSKSNCKIISFIAQKGGASKTTDVLNLGFSLPLTNKKNPPKVLMIDLDDQCNLTRTFSTESIGYSLGNIDEMDMETWFIDSEEETDTVSQFIYPEDKKKYDPKSFIKELNKNIHYIRGSRELSIKALINQIHDSQNFLKYIGRAIDKIKDQFDYILLDCPPNLASVTTNAILASDYVIIPVTLDRFAMDGLGATLSTISEAYENRADKTLLGVIANRHDSREAVSLEIHDALKNLFPKLLFGNYISNATDVKKAQCMQNSIIEYSPSHKVSQQFVALAKEIIKRINDHESGKVKLPK